MAVVSWLERVGVKRLGRLLRAVDVGFHDAGIQSAPANGKPAKLDSRRAATQIWSPHLCEPAAARQIPTVSRVSCCAALEPSFSLLKLPGLSLNTCACLARATPRYRRPARTHLEYNIRKRNTYRSLTATLRTRESPGGYL